jgi:hypothetical protein
MKQVRVLKEQQEKDKRLLLNDPMMGVGWYRGKD